MKKFEAVLMEVMEELGQEWYEVIDGEGLALVEERCSAMLGYDCNNDKDYQEWLEEKFYEL